MEQDCNEIDPIDTMEVNSDQHWPKRKRSGRHVTVVEARLIRKNLGFLVIRFRNMLPKPSWKHMVHHVTHDVSKSVTNMV